MANNADSPVHEIEQDPDEVLAYWTEERISNARPFPMPERADRASASDVKPTKGASKDDAIGVPEPADIDVMPYKACGRLLSAVDGVSYWCSASLVNYDNIVLTAAHCLVTPAVEGPVWHTNIGFHLAQPEFFYVARNIGMWANWYETGKPVWPFDYAFIEIASPVFPLPTEFLNLKTNNPYDSWIAAGYPTNYGGGKTQYEVEGTAGTSKYPGSAQMDDNPFSGGSSGGPWVGDPGTDNDVIGINSTSNGSTMWSPEFNTATGELLKKLKGS